MTSLFDFIKLCFIIWYTDIQIYFPVCHFRQYISVTTLFNFFYTSQDLTDMINSYFRRNAFWGSCFLLVSNILHRKLFPMKKTGFVEMEQRMLFRRRSGGKRPDINIKHYNPDFYGRSDSLKSVFLKRDECQFDKVQLALQFVKPFHT